MVFPRADRMTLCPVGPFIVIVITIKPTMALFPIENIYIN